MRDTIILQKIIMYCQRISDNLERYHHDFSAFENDHLFQDACCMCVVQIGEDEYHLEVGACPREEIYHICQFAELMERAGNTVEPLRAPACKIKNLSQLKKCLKAGSRLEIIGHCRPECIGEMRKVTLANTQGFYSIVDGESPDSRLNQGNKGKGSVLHWSNAPFWTFRDGVCGLYSDKDHTEKNLIMAFRVLTDAA